MFKLKNQCFKIKRKNLNKRKVFCNTLLEILSKKFLRKNKTNQKKFKFDSSFKIFFA